MGSTSPSRSLTLAPTNTTSSTPTTERPRGSRSPTISKTTSPTTIPTSPTTPSPTTGSPTLAPTKTTTSTPTTLAPTKTTSSTPTNSTCASPGSNCFIKQLGQGCDDESCMNVICESKAQCCDKKWNKKCANTAIKKCNICSCSENVDGIF